jgi:hypothetical protein
MEVQKSQSYIRSLNESCDCKSLSKKEWEERIAEDELFSFLPDQGIFSESNFFLRRSHLKEIEKLIQDIEALVAKTEKSKSFKHGINTEIKPTNPGFLLAYDFHITEDQPYLIEINSNPGGFILSTISSHHHAVCCSNLYNGNLVELPIYTKDIRDTVCKIILNEWVTSRPNGLDSNLPRGIAIVDSNPELQFLYPEFLMYQNIFQSLKIPTYILDPKDLTEIDGNLFYKENPIDLVYNRHTDFYFNSDDSHLKSIETAYRKGNICLTPHPYIYENFSDKENLIHWSDEMYLRKITGIGETIDSGLGEERISRIKKMIPVTRPISELNEEDLWKNRKKYFFKPINGYGSKAVYRGDKLTRKVFDSILEEDTIVQENIAPALRMVDDSLLKSDVRVFSYRGEILGLTSRLYQGQVTNFRTPGGGFAPVMIVE